MSTYNDHETTMSDLESNQNNPTVDLNFDDTSSEGEADSIFSADGGRSRSSSVSSIMHSNASETYGFRYENGRRYNGFREGSYVLPNDEREQDRMAIQDQMINLLLNGERYLAPLQNPRRILDIGTGTGVWAVDMAHKFPNARVIGTDLSPIQVPPPDNCTFEIEDVNSDWIYPVNYFSMIHTRQLLCGIVDWRRVCEQAYTHLHPDGWIEFHETPVILHSENPAIDLSAMELTRSATLFNESMALTGRNTSTEIYLLKDHLRSCGFVDIEETIIKLPLGPWMADPRMKQVGLYNMLNFLEGIEGFMMAACTRTMEMSIEETSQLIDNCTKDIKNKRAKVYVNLIVARGRKPAACEVLPQTQLS